MNRFIPEETILDIQQSTDIVELISEYLPLKKAGANYKALCPFHEEKTASFTVNPTKQIYHCFGCHKGGNIFSFLMEFEKMEFPAAARSLAERAGIKLPTIETPAEQYTKEKRAELLKTNRMAANYYHKKLIESKEGEAARAYLKKRGFSQSLIARFLLGFAPAGWDNLLGYARQQHIGTNYLEEVGLILPRRERQGHYDRFRNRLMFPIFNTRDHVIGFGGRALDDSEPVYLNSPESSLFSKGKTLYGLNFAKDSAAKTGKLYVVEGYTDVIMAHQYGFGNFIATLGTSLTFNHIKSIKRFVSRVVLVYDADTGGEVAAERLLGLFLPEDIDLSIVRLPAGLDPYDCLTQKGPEVFKKSLENAQDLFTCRLDLTRHRYNMHNMEEKIKAVDEILSFIRPIPNIVRRNLYIKQMSEEFNLDERLLKLRLKDTARARTPEGKPEKALVSTMAFSSADKQAIEEIIEIMLTRNEYIPIINRSIQPEDYPTPQAKEVTEAIFKAQEKYGKVTVPILLSLISDNTELTTWVVGIIEQGRLKDIKDYKAQVNGLLSFFNRRRDEQNRAVLKQRLREANIKGDHAEINRILKELQKNTKGLLSASKL